MAKNDAVSKKIKHLMAEGKSQKAALGEALGMKDQGRLTHSGGYKRVKPKLPSHKRQ